MWIVFVVPPALLLLAMLLQRLEEAVLTDLDTNPNAGLDVPEAPNARLTSVPGAAEGPARGPGLAEPEPARHVTRASA